MADFIPWPPPPSDPVKGVVLQAARTMRDSVLIRTITMGELEQFARAVLAAYGVTRLSNTDPAGRADWVGKPGVSLPHDAPSGGKGAAAGATRQAGETPATSTAGVAPDGGTKK